MIINCISNGRGETAGIFAGALEPAYRAAVEEARKHYVTTRTTDNDIVIANNFMKAAEFNMALSGMQALKPEGGTIVLIASSPSGQVVHYLFDSFGKTIAGSVSQLMPVPPHVNRIIIYNEYPEAKIYGRFANPEKVLQTDDWKKVIETLTRDHGDSPKVAVYPNADNQYFAD
jgi:hypothetical protein